MRKVKMYFLLSHIERETKNLVLAHLRREFSVPQWSSSKARISKVCSSIPSKVSFEPCSRQDEKTSFLISLVYLLKDKLFYKDPD